MSTEAGEKLRDRALKFFPTLGGASVDIMTAFACEELEKAAEIAADYANHMFGQKIADEIAAAIRQRML